MEKRKTSCAPPRPPRFAPAGDPMGYPDGMDAYEFVEDNPIALVDPTGLRAMTTDEFNTIGLLGHLASEANSTPGQKAFADAILGVMTDLAKAIQDTPDGQPLHYNLEIEVEALRQFEAQNLKDPTAIQNWSVAGDGSGPVGSGISVGPRQDKCNGFVAAVLFRATGQSFLTRSHPGWPLHPFAAVDWGNGNVAATGFFGPVRTTFARGTPADAAPGDVIATGGPGVVGGTKHAGIYLGHGIYVSATTAPGSGGNQPSDGVKIRFIDQVLAQSGGKLNITHLEKSE